jgi:hypothetical protein
MAQVKKYAFDDIQEELVDSITLLLPCRRFYIGYSVSTKRAFSIVDEFMLRLLRVTDGMRVEQIQDYFGFTILELQSTLDPLIENGLIIRMGDRFILSKAGENLFEASGNEQPRITKIELQDDSFTLDYVSFMPAPFKNLSTWFGDLRVGLDALVEISVNTVKDSSQSASAARSSFARNWIDFLEAKHGRSALTERKWELYKTEYVRPADKYLLPVSVSSVVNMSADCSTLLKPYEAEKIGPSHERIVQVIMEEARKVAEGEDLPALETITSWISPSALDRYWRFGVFQFEEYIGSVVAAENELSDEKGIYVFGASYIERNASIILDCVKNAVKTSRLRKKKDDSNPVAVECIWVRPSRASWGRTVLFHEFVERLRQVVEAETSVELILSLAQNTANTDHRHGEQGLRAPIKAYSKCMDNLLTFRSSEIPENVEIILIRGWGVMVLAHGLKPVNSLMVCPIGYFTASREAAAEMEARLHLDRWTSL